MSDFDINYQWLKELSFAKGAKLFGVADIQSHQAEIRFDHLNTRPLKYGVVLAIPLSKAVLDDIQNEPTLLYKWHYRQANNLLDKMAFELSVEITEKGFQAVPIPASQVIDWTRQIGHVSHRALGEAAGLGWRGRNNLLVTKAYGSRVRLVSILTNFPLKTDQAIKPQCGSCRECIAACPAHALGEKPSDYQLDKCYAHLKEFSKIKGVGQNICGICIRVCPGEEI